jgi:hypothetical protein
MAGHVAVVCAFEPDSIRLYVVDSHKARERVGSDERVLESILDVIFRMLLGSVNEGKRDG